MELRIIKCFTPLDEVEGLFWSRHDRPSYYSTMYEQHYELYNKVGQSVARTNVSLYADPRGEGGRFYCEIIPPYKVWNQRTRYRRAIIKEDSLMQTLENLTNEFLLLDVDGLGKALSRSYDGPIGSSEIDVSEGLHDCKIVHVFGVRKSMNAYYPSAPWGAVMNWNPSTGKAKGFIRLDGHGWKPKSLRIDRPEDIRDWALTVLRIDGMV